MKKWVQGVVILLIASTATGCYDRDIIDMKEFGHELPQVENLDYAKAGSSVKLTWTIPANVSASFRRPLETSIQKVEDGVYREIIIVGAEANTRDIAIDASKEYRFVVKLAGYLTDEAREKGKPDRVYSEGRIIEVR